MIQLFRMKLQIFSLNLLHIISWLKFNDKLLSARMVSKQFV